MRYEKGVLRLLEPLRLKEGEEAQIVIQQSESVAKKFYGIARRHRPDLGREEFIRVLEEVEDEGLRGH